MAGRDFSAAEKTLHKSGSGSGEHAIFLKTDLENDESLNSLITEIQKEQSLHCLIHSAAYYSFNQNSVSGVEEMDRSYRVNLRAPYLITQKLMPLLQAGNGTVVFLNSSVVNTAKNQHIVPYTVTKTALKNLADNIRAQMPEGVRVLSVYPGRTATPLQRNIYALEGKPYQPEKLLQPALVARMIVKYLVEPAEYDMTDLYIRSVHKT